MNSDGFSRTALPAASAGKTFHPAVKIGAFQGVMASTTPSASRRTMTVWPDGTGMTRPSILSHQPAQYSAISATRATSARASRRGLPVCADSSRARFSAACRNSGAMAQSRRPRSAPLSACHSRWARTATPAACATSVAPALAYSSNASPVAGSCKVIFAPSPATISPSTRLPTRPPRSVATSCSMMLLASKDFMACPLLRWRLTAD